MMQELGLDPSISWLSTAMWSTTWLALMLAYTPLADMLAARLT